MTGKNNGKINMIKRVLFIVVIFVSTIIGILIINYVFVSKFKIREAGKEQSPNGKYFVEFQMIGEAKWPFGPINAKIIIKSTKGDFTKTIKTRVYADGGDYGSDYWVVNWSDDAVEIIIADESQENNRFNFTLE